MQHQINFAVQMNACTC